MKELRMVTANWLFAAANCADTIGAAARETFGILGMAVKPKRQRKPKAPSWLLEHREAVEKSWPQ